MSKTSKPAVQQAEGNRNAKTGEFETKVFAKSGHPKTLKETIKLVLNLFVNLLG